jgi:hypothetical protein
MSRAAVWLCKAEAEGRPEGYSGITHRALRHKMGFGSRDDPIWVCLLEPPHFLSIMLMKMHLGAVPDHPQDTRSEHAYARPLSARPRLVGCTQLGHVVLSAAARGEALQPNGVTSHAAGGWRTSL